MVALPLAKLQPPQHCLYCLLHCGVAVATAVATCHFCRYFIAASWLLLLFLLLLQSLLPAYAATTRAWWSLPFSVHCSMILPVPLLLLLSLHITAGWLFFKKSAMATGCCASVDAAAALAVATFVAHCCNISDITAIAACFCHQDRHCCWLIVTLFSAYFCGHSWCFLCCHSPSICQPHCCCRLAMLEDLGIFLLLVVALAAACLLA